MSRSAYSKEQRDEAFLSRILYIPFHSCWEWNGYKAPDGYARFNHRTNGIGSHLAHRYSFLYFKGQISKEFVVDHVCRNRGCVNPDHLRLVSRQINSVENSVSPPAFNAKKTHCNAGHEFTTSNTGKQTNGGRYCKTCKRITTKKTVRTWYYKHKKKKS